MNQQCYKKKYNIVFNNNIYYLYIVYYLKYAFIFKKDGNLRNF